MQPVPGMANVVVSVTNYFGESREDLVTMLISLGATYTTTLSLSNTHLICGGYIISNLDRAIGTKFERALTWNIHIVNHLWVEETYANWLYQKEGRPRFLQFPLGICKPSFRNRQLIW
jgi:hypothetical protein